MIVASPIGKHTSLASSSKIGIIGMIKKPKETDVRATISKTSVCNRNIINTVETILPNMPRIDNFLCALVFFKILIKTTLPIMPAPTQVALNVLVCHDSKPYGPIS